MSESTHTPKPWHAEFSEEEQCWQVVYSPSDDVIATVLTDTLTPYPDHDGEANAALIAAAPDLLAACDIVLKNLELEKVEDGKKWRSRNQYLIDKMSDAISKAKGGAS